MISLKIKTKLREKLVLWLPEGKDEGGKNTGKMSKDTNLQL